MALNLQNLKNKITSAKDIFANALFGVPAEVEQAEGNVQYQYPTQRQADFMQGLPSNKDLLGKIQASPYNQGYTDEEIINRVAQGQNFGLGELANEQKEWGIKLPRANNELDEEAVRGNYLNIYQPKLQTGTATTPRQGGFFNDLAKGYEENLTQKFDFQNLAPDKNKSFATRLGEGAGSLVSFYNKPIARGLLGAAAALALGGGAGGALAMGLGTTVARQRNMTRDEAYRQGLINMGVKEAQVNAIPGIVSNDIFSNIARAKQLQDYAQYRQDMIEAQKEQNKIMQENKMAELSQKVAQNQLENYYKGQQIAQGWEKIKNDKEGVGKPNFNQITTMRKEFSSIPAIKNANEIKRQFDNVTNTYNAYKQGKLRANAADQAMVTTLNKILDPTSVVRESEFARTAAGQSIFARMQGYFDKISKGGGGLTNAEREDLYNAMQEMYNANQAEAREYINAYSDLANRYNINPADIMPRQYSSSETSTNNKTTQNSGQMVKMKSPDGKIYNVPIEKVETMKAKGGVVING